MKELKKNKNKNKKEQERFKTHRMATLPGIIIASLEENKYIDFASRENLPFFLNHCAAVASPDIVQHGLVSMYVRNSPPACCCFLFLVFPPNRLSSSPLKASKLPAFFFFFLSGGFLQRTVITTRCHLSGFRRTRAVSPN